MEKVRGVMLAFEALDSPHFMASNGPALGGCDDYAETVEYAQMLLSAGYLVQSQRSVYRITWEGHEFIDKVRDPEIWRQTKAGASKLGSFSVRLLGELASGYLRAKAQALGLPLAD